MLVVCCAPTAFKCLFEHEISQNSPSLCAGSVRPLPAMDSHDNNLHHHKDTPIPIPTTTATIPPGDDRPRLKNATTTSSSSSPHLSSEAVHLQLLTPITADEEAREDEGMRMDEGMTEETEKEERSRVQWDRKSEYLLTVLGYSVGLGNIFRFPYLCNRNGGGAFLLPFLISLTLIGLPLFSMEVVMAQFSGRNCLQVWAICPIFKGVGVSMVMLSSMVFWYYGTTLSWALYYLVCSFRTQLPWASCGHAWNTDHCYVTAVGVVMSSVNTSSSANATALSGGVKEYGVGGINGSLSAFGNSTGAGNNVTTAKDVSSAEEFWQHNALQLSSGFDELGSVVWYLALTLTFTSMILFFALMKGIRSSGKVVYVTATAPYVLLTILLIRGALLPGAKEGIIFYLKPDFAKLLHPQVWIEAAMQVFFSLGACWGGLIVTASFNKFHNNCLRDSLILTLASEGTSVYGGFAIFSMLGYMAHVSGKDIDKVVTSGPGLAFVVYPEAVSLMPWSQLWAVLFFLNVFSLGIDSQITNAEVLLTTLIDLSPRLLRRHRAVLTAAVCSTVLLLSLPFVTQGGMYLFQLMDWFIGTLSVTIIGFVECLVLGWIYGMSRLGDDIYLMLGRRPPFLFRLFVRFITPLLLLVMLVATLLKYTPPTYGEYEYGPGATFFGWCVAVSSVLPIPAVALYQLYKAEGTVGQRLQQTLKPDYSVWKPSDVDARRPYQKERQLHM